MPKKVIVTTLWSCSLCELETEEDKIAAYTISGNGSRLHYDICATCMASEPFATLLAAGMTDKMAGKATTVTAVDDSGKAKCLYCEKSYTENGMGMHLASAHGVKSKTQLTLEKRGKTGKLVCSECGFRTNAPQGLAAHQVARHGKAAVKPAVGHPCPDCPDFVAENAQGLGAHRRHIHPGEPKLGHGGGHRSRAKA